MNYDQLNLLIGIILEEPDYYKNQIEESDGPSLLDLLQDSLQGELENNKDMDPRRIDLLKEIDKIVMMEINKKVIYDGVKRRNKKNRT